MKKMVNIIIAIILFLSCLLLEIRVEATEKQSKVEYKDWSELREEDISYTYSKIYYNDRTKVEIKKNDGIERWSVKNNINLPSIVLRKGQEAIFVITNCAMNKKGQTLDVVIKLNNVNEWNESSYGVSIAFDTDKRLNSQANPMGDNNNGYDYEIPISRGELITFSLGATKADCDFTITYYVAGTYQYEQENNVESGELGEITSVNGYFYDFDVVANYPNEVLNGNEGIIPLTGNSTIYYNKNRYSISESYAHLQELNDGIAIKKHYNKGVNCNANWYQTAVYVATKDITNSTYTFKYVGAGAGILYSFMSPYPLTIKQEISKIKLVTADGKAINSLELKDGKVVNELKSAFISDGIYLIVDNEMIQSSRIEIEYKFKVKNNAYTPCTELIIENYLDKELTCQSENWEYDGEKIKLHIYGDKNNPIIMPDEEYETTMVASKLLSSSSTQYSFRNKAIAKDPNVGEEATSDIATTQTINIIPPFGNMDKFNALIIGIMAITLIIILWKKVNKRNRILRQ